MDKMSAQRDVRSLSNLGDTASTSRVLNLGQIYKTSASDTEYRRRPFFQNTQLNRAIVLKHTVRLNEKALFSKAKRTATKVILPFDPHDLKLGGQSILVGQIGFDAFLKHVYNTKDFAAHPDIEVLRALDGLPSLDPFLVREHLARQGHKPAPCYLKISPADIARMIGFANAEIESLVQTAFGTATQQGTVKLTGKILSDELDSDLDPLRQVLRLSPAEFSDGIFSWRGFLYFKWRHQELQDELHAVLDGLATYQPAPSRDRGLTQFLNELRPKLAKGIVAAIANTSRTLEVYDRAYNSLVGELNPGPFRRFLLDGPSLFFELGEHLGILSHISSFWNYRMKGPRGMVRLAAEDYADLLVDYEDSLSILYVDGEVAEPAAAPSASVWK